MANIYKDHCDAGTCYVCEEDVPTYTPVYCCVYVDNENSCDGCEYGGPCVLDGDPANAPICEECR